MAEYLNMDVTLVRILTVLISLFTGVPVILYIIALFVMPEGTTRPTAPPPVTGCLDVLRSVLGAAVRDPAARVRPVPDASGAGAATAGATAEDAVWGSEGPPWEQRQPETAAADRARPRAAPPASEPVAPSEPEAPVVPSEPEAPVAPTPRRPRTSRRPDPRYVRTAGRSGDQLCGRCASGGADQVQEVAVDPEVAGDLRVERRGQQVALPDRDDVGLVGARAA